MRINLIPPEERASLRTIQTPTILFIAGTIIVAGLVFATVYLRWQVANERERLGSYQTTMSTLNRYRTEVSKLEKETHQLEELVKPLEEQLAANRTPTDLSLFLSRVTSSAQTGHVWLRELSVHKDGVASLDGYAVEFSEVSRFLSALGRDPLTVQMGSTRWTERGGVRLLSFSAKVRSAGGGDLP